MVSLMSINHDFSDCLYNSIASVANSMCNVDYEIIGAGAWWFDFRETMPGQENLLWNQIHAFRFDAWKCLEDYYGIKVTWHDVAMVEEILPDIYREIAEKRPVLIYINSHFCPWHPRRAEYNAHFCLIMDFDWESEEFICMDVNPVKYGERLSLELFSKGCGPYITFLKTDKLNQCVDWKEIICSATERLIINSEQNSFDLMRVLASKIANEIENLKGEMPDWIENPIPVVLKTGLLQKGREYFSITLQYLAKQCKVEELMPISERMTQAAQKWKVISFLAIKSQLDKSNRSSLVRIPEKILEIADFEEQILLDLTELLKNHL